MLSARSTNTMAAPAASKELKKDTKIKLKNTTNTRKGGGLKVSDPNTIASTINNKPKVPSLLKPTSNAHVEEPIKKKAQPIKSEKTKQTSKQKSDENEDLNEFIQHPYDPLLYVHPFDEELYQKVLKLELADDGLPSPHCDEPFDF